MGVRQMTREQKQMARRLKAKGLTLKEIARDLSCSLALVTASVYVQREGVGVPDRWKPAPGHLSAEEREEILLGLGRKESMSAIARSLGRAPSTITREVAANGGAVRYGAWRAHCRAEASSRRPKPAKLAHPPLARQVTTWLERLWSPQEISARLRLEFEGDPMMQVSHETIYQSLFVQGRGELRRELARCLCSGRTARRHQGRVEKRGKIPNMVMISERPTEVEDRAVPGYMGRPSGSAALVLVDATTPLRVEPALFNAMLEGWRRQHVARRLSPSLISDRERLVRRFREFCGSWPWEWRCEQLDAWIAQGHWAHSTIRSYEGSLSLFMEFLCDPNYGWSTECLDQVGVAPHQIAYERNSAVHVADYEGRPERRPLTRGELQALFDVGDAAVDEAARSARKGWLAAFRDATLFKVIYAWGLRRTEAAMLDVGDFGANPAAPELGAFGMCQVRFGKAMRGSPPKRRAVATVLPWSVGVLAQYVEEVRPLHGPPARGPALFLTERGTRISPRSIDDRFAAWRAAAELPSELSVHCLRHSYISHGVEDGMDPLFVQYQAGHSWASSTAGYTKVGSDHMNKMLRSALDRAFLSEEQ